MTRLATEQMGVEGHHRDRKPLREVTGHTADFAEFAQHCVCFAKGVGGTSLIGSEDGQDVPPSNLRIDATPLDHSRRRVGEIIVNVQVLPGLLGSGRADLHSELPARGSRRLE